MVIAVQPVGITALLWIHVGEQGELHGELLDLRWNGDFLREERLFFRDSAAHGGVEPLIRPVVDAEVNHHQLGTACLLPLFHLEGFEGEEAAGTAEEQFLAIT